MPDHRTGAGGEPCPSDESLAAFIDRALTPDEERSVRAHLAVCDRCSELVMGVVDVQGGLDAEPDDLHGLEEVADAAVSDSVRPAEATAPGRSHAWVGSASDRASRVDAPVESTRVLSRGRWTRHRAVLVMGAALAAMLVVAAVLSPAVRTPSSSGTTPESVVAVATYRPVDARLADGLEYRPYRGPTRSASSADRLPFVADEKTTRESAASHPGDDTGHAWGLSLLRLGRLDEAVGTLEDVASRRPADAGLQSDAGAARLTRFTTLGRQADVVAALEHFDRALRLNPAMPEASFDRALALEVADRRGEAALAWTKYLELDSRSPWAAEARTRLDRLRSPGR